jgi:Tfp pilus assembly protein PilO
MTFLLSMLVVASILSMAWAFSAAGSMESSVEELEKRFLANLEEEEKAQEAAEAEAAGKGGEK